MATIGRLEPFEVGVDDWQLYNERLDQFFLANGITEVKKMVATLVTAVGQKAYSLMRNLTAPALPASKKYRSW